MTNPDFSNLDLTLEDLQYINVVGTSGVGKSTIAKQLAAALDQVYIEMDQVYWGPNWTEPNVEEYRIRLKSVLADHKSWVLDGNYMSKSEDIKWKLARTVVWVDYSFLRTIRQAVGRAINRSATQKELWPGTGNTESFRRSFFSSDSVVLWTLKTYGQVRRRYQAKMVDPRFEHLKFVRLHNPIHASRFLAHVKSLVGTI